MNLLKENVQKYFLDEKMFRIFYILSMFLTSLCFVEHVFQAITGICMVWAVFLMKNRFEEQTSIKNIRYFIWLVLFVGSGIITSILYIQDNFGMNMLMMYHVTICFILLYGIHAQKDKDAVYEEMLTILKWITIFSTVFAVIGLVLFFVFVKIEAFGYVVGLFKNRFTGLYTHPNISAFCSIAGVVSSHMIYHVKESNGKELVSKKFIQFGWALHSLTILLTDSNAGVLFIITYVGVNLLFRGKKIEEVKKLKHILKVGIFCAIALVLSLAMRGVAQNAMASFINAVHMPAETSTGEPVETYVPEMATEEAVEIELGRGERKDFSSGRFDSFQKAFTLLKMKPILGIGKENIIDYGLRYLPEGFRYFDLHNGYLTILLSCGILGFSLFVGFTINVVKKVWETMLKIDELEQSERRFFISSLGMLVSYCLYSMFERTMLFDITFMVAIFWLILGYLMTFIVTKEEEQGKVVTTDFVFKRRRILLPVPVQILMTVYLVGVTVIGVLIFQ